MSHRQRRVLDHVEGLVADVHRQRIDEGLEGRAGLPQRLGRAVEGARDAWELVAPADHARTAPSADITTIAASATESGRTLVSKTSSSAASAAFWMRGSSVVG
jgi:hypothetical protein